MVCEDVVAIVNADVLELAFLITYILPVMVAALGKVSVVADVPVNIRLQSEISAVYADVNVLTLVAKDP